ncbi:helix-turn-helix transcriptional regulator [Kutzneria viridogrisea]
MTTDHIGQSIYRLRTGLSLTQRQLAEPRYTAAYVSSVESGRRVPSGDALRHFAARLGVAEEQLRTGQSPDRHVTADLAVIEAALAGDVSALIEVEPQRPARVALVRGHLALAAGQTADEHFDRSAHLLAEAPSTALVDCTIGRALCLLGRQEANVAAHLVKSAADGLYAANHLDPVSLLLLNALLAQCQLRAGDERQARRAATTALGLGPLPDPRGSCAMYLAWARTLLVDNEIDQAALVAEQAWQVYRQVPLGTAVAHCLRARGSLDDLAAAQRGFAAAGLVEDALACQVDAAELNRTNGRAETSRALLTEVLASAGAGTLAQARAQHTLALLALDKADRVTAEPLLRSAMETLLHAGSRVVLAATTRELGDLLVAEGRHTEAAEVLVRGLGRIGQLVSPNVVMD